MQRPWLIGLMIAMPGLLGQAPLRALPEAFLREYARTVPQAHGDTGQSTADRQQYLRSWKQDYIPQNTGPHHPMIGPRDPGSNRFRLEQIENILTRINALRQQYRQSAFKIEIDTIEQHPGSWWKIIDARAQMQRQQQQLANHISQQIVTLALDGLKIRAEIDDLDLLQQPTQVEQATRLYRSAIVHQVELAQMEAALTQLQGLQAINPQTQDWYMHYYFARCLQSRLNRQNQQGGRTEQELRTTRANKHLHLRLAIQQRYGVDSDEYRFVDQRLRFAELGSPRQDLNRKLIP
ncbi:MAG: hypothetical protein KDK39_18555 [Leptospiraceae bacterium]|nr:hypothetical protein [Leptospiraceae bacterium]